MPRSQILAGLSTPPPLLCPPLSFSLFRPLFPLPCLFFIFLLPSTLYFLCPFFLNRFFFPSSQTYPLPPF